MAYIGAAAAGTVLQGAGTGLPPKYSTATYPLTTTANQILYSSATNVVGQITTGNSKVLTTDGSGVPALSQNYIPKTTYVPVLSFGGGTTGITYGIQTGNYFQIGNLVFVNIQITLTNKGSSTGLASITLPVTSLFKDILTLNAGNFTFVGDYLVFNTNANNTIIQLVTTAGALTNLTDSAFGNTTVLNISGCYLS